MTVEQQGTSHTEGGFLQGAMGQGLNFYRKTFKRLRPVHAGLHRLMRGAILPALERLTHFQTMPDDPLWFRLELLLKRHEAETTHQVTQLVQPGMVVLDIGAHVGYYARLFAGCVGSKGRVVAFEPHPRTYQTLQKNVGALDTVTAFQVAAAEEEGTAELYDYLMMSASGSLHYDESMRDLQRASVHEGDIAPRLETDFQVETFSVRTRPVDDCLAELGIEKVDFIKMDIEGAEIGALRSMKHTIAHSPGLMLIMEYNPQALKAFGHDPVAALQEVLDMGFTRVQAIEADGSLTNLTGYADRITTLTDRLMAHMGVINLLFTRES